jgi:hypothetical protein
MSSNQEYDAADYAYTAKLLRQHADIRGQELFRAVCSNNLAIILAALDAAAADATAERKP